MQLVEERTLSLDLDVNTWLPFEVRSPTAPSQPITLRALLGHTAGLRDNWDALNATLIEGDSPISLASWVRDYFSPEGAWYDANANFQAWAPGGGYQPSQVGLDLAAYVVETATGGSFEDYCRLHLFAPLSLKTAAWHLAGLDPGLLAMPYGPGEGGAPEPYGHYGYAGYPEGTLRASARELGVYLAAMTQKGVWHGVRVLGEAAADEMFAIQAPALAPDQAASWSYQDRPPGRLLGQAGADLGVATIMMMRPSDRVGALVLANGEWNDSGALDRVLDRLIDEAAAL
jgi:CubicO group peptidase (beta-lactamase class C family)